MTEHDRRILADKNRPAADRDALAEFAQTHHWCQACGRDGPKTIHHIIGGRGGRSDEACNLLYLCWEPCHMLAEGLDVPDDRAIASCGSTQDTTPRLLPKLTLGIQLSLKIRAGELTAPLVMYIPIPEWMRLTALHGRTLPPPEPIPQFFVDLFRKNRPELTGRQM